MHCRCRLITRGGTPDSLQHFFSQRSSHRDLQLSGGLSLPLHITEHQIHRQKRGRRRIGGDDLFPLVDSIRARQLRLPDVPQQLLLSDLHNSPGMEGDSLSFKIACLLESDLSLSALLHSAVTPCCIRFRPKSLFLREVNTPLGMEHSGQRACVRRKSVLRHWRGEILRLHHPRLGLYSSLAQQHRSFAVIASRTCHKLHPQAGRHRKSGPLEYNLQTDVQHGRLTDWTTP